MIIRPRIGVVRNRRKSIGIIGRHTLQRSVRHIRRLLISRAPDYAPVEWQDAMDQPIGWQGEDMLASDDPAMLSSGQEPYRRTAPRRQSTGGQMQRQTEASGQSPQHMPRDLQAIFNLHKSQGRIESDPNVRRQAELYNKTGGGVTRAEDAPAEAPPARPASPSKRDTRRPAQRKPAPDTPPPGDDDFPVVLDLTSAQRRVRSRVEYVNRAEKKQGQAPSEAGDDGDAESSIVAQPASSDTPLQRQPDATPPPSAPPASDPADQPTLIDSDPVSPPTDQPPVQRSPDTDVPEDHDEAVEAAITRAEQPSPAKPQAPEAPPAPTQKSEAPVQRQPDATPPATEPPADTPQRPDVQQRSSLQRQPDSAPPADHDEAIEAAIQRAEQPPAERPQKPRQPGQMGRRLTVSDPKPPSRIQRRALPDDAVEDDALDAAWPEDYDEGPAGQETYLETDQAPPPADRPRADVTGPAPGQPGLQMQRDAQAPIRDDYDPGDLAETDYFMGEEPPSLPEQPVDLGTALFGTSAGDDPADSGPEPILMPPIGRAHHPKKQPPTSPPSTTVQRTPDDSMSGDVRPPAPPQRSTPQPPAHRPAPPVQRQTSQTPPDNIDQPTADEAELLTLLDMPADTPIQRGGEAQPPIQRAAEDSPPTTSAPGAAAESTDTEESEEGGDSAVREMADKVYRLIKRRLKIEQERYRNK